MTNIFKYSLPLTHEQTVEMPSGAKILCAQLQHDEINIWAVIDRSAPAVQRKFVIHGTGHESPSGHLGAHVGTVQMGPYVWHVFDGGEAA